MTFLRLTMMIGLLIGAAFLAWQMFPGKSKLLITTGETHFPTVSGYNLKRQNIEFPRDFSGNLNLLIIPFQQHQQIIVNTWIPVAQEFEGKIPGFIYYELPTIYEMPAIARSFINEGMRAGIPDQTARERTITLYLDKDSFKSALGITNEDDIYLFLVDRDGRILWRTNGEYTQEKENDLLKTLKGSI